MSAKPAPFVDPSPAAQKYDADQKEADVSQSEKDRVRDEKAHAAERRQMVIDSLLFERQGYVVNDKPDRVKQVDAALKAAGYSAPAQRRAPSTTKSEG